MRNVGLAGSHNEWDVEDYEAGRQPERLPCRAAWKSYVEVSSLSHACSAGAFTANAVLVMLLLHVNTPAYPHSSNQLLSHL